MPTGNKGEWSEVYAFAKLLADGKVFAADEDLNPLASEVYQIESILREELRFKRDTTKIAFYRNGIYEGCYPLADLIADVPNMLTEINAGANTFSSPTGTKVMSKLNQTKLKAPSTSKTDLVLKLRDPRSVGLPDLGFSIKSYLGNPPTLFNASHATKFVFELAPFFGSLVPQVDSFLKGNPTPSQMKNFIFDLIDNGVAILKFNHMMDECCRRNFILVDSSFPQIFAEAMLIHFYGKANKMDDICRILEIEDPLFADVPKYYEKKITDFLVNVALGMEPASPWSTQEEANGGYIVVKKDGDVICYNVYDRAKFRGYLLKHCKFDTPSSTKFLNSGETTPDGFLYIENGKVYVNLNRQVRFC